MTTKKESVGQLLIKLAHRLGVAILVFWFLEFVFNERNHFWLDFNLNHPVIMVAGGLLALFSVTRFLYWVSHYKKSSL